MNYPEEIMHDVAWSFVGMQYRSQKQFIEAVNDYNEKLGTTGRWNPYATAIQCKEVTIQYSYWSDEEDEEVEEDFNLVSTTSAFTNAELLFRIHNFVVDKLKYEDNHFFEGLTLWEGENPSSFNAPLYFLMQGN